MDNINSEFFSLEDDDVNELFITQTPRESVVNQLKCTQNVRNYSVFGGEEDFALLCSSLVDSVKGKQPIYSDISDDDNVFENANSSSNSGSVLLCS